MNTGFELQLAEHTVSLHREDQFLEAPQISFVCC